MLKEKVIIGITGGIGSGKSVVSRILRLKGFPVYDCDYESKVLMRRDKCLLRQIRCLLGEESILENGELNRKYVAERIFKDESLRVGMNAIVHGVVKEDFLLWAAAEMSQTVFCESAILASSGFADFCDSVWIVDAPKDVRIARVMKRNAMTEEQVTARMMSQESETELLADMNPEVITNAGITSLLTKIENLLNLDIKKIEICLEKF